MVQYANAYLVRRKPIQLEAVVKDLLLEGKLCLKSQ
jgi:hypothetical protein